MREQLYSDINEIVKSVKWKSVEALFNDELNALFKAIKTAKPDELSQIQAKIQQTEYLIRRPHDLIAQVESIRKERKK